MTQILKWIEDSNFDELELRMGEMKLVVKKRRDGSPTKEEVAPNSSPQAVLSEKGVMEVGKGKPLCTAHEMEDRTGEI